jgi:oxidase EvaA
VETNFGPTTRWMQPILNQSEIGILGFLTREIAGTVHFLVQLKAEPGNVGTLQLSPTVQATVSNYSQVHGGSHTPYLEYFLGGKARTVVDQLQPEQGSRFLRKRNRNMIVEVDPQEPVELLQDFCWLTLAQLTDLCAVDNLVNMDSRTVLSCLPFDPPAAEAAERNMPQILDWLERMRSRYRLKLSRVPLQELDGWIYDGREIFDRDRRYFSVLGVGVTATSREVVEWQQPLVAAAGHGIVCFLCQRRHGVRHFLVQCRVEPGYSDIVQLGATVQCTPSSYRPEDLPPFVSDALAAEPRQVLYSALQSEEGGRFYQDNRRYLIVELDPGEERQLPDNYLWMTQAQIRHLIRSHHCFNIEARSLIACLGIDG